MTIVYLGDRHSSNSGMDRSATGVMPNGNNNTGSLLSGRAAATASGLDRPWRFAPRGDYDAETNPGGLVSFGTAENTLITKELEEFSRQVEIPAQAFRYAYSTGGGPELPGLLAAHLNETLGLSSSSSAAAAADGGKRRPVRAADVQLTAAATPLHETLGWALGDAGDGVLTTAPVYGRFELDFGNRAGLRMVYVEPEDDDDCQREEKRDGDDDERWFARCFAPGIAAAYERRLERAAREGTRVCAVLLVNPHNPLGRCYPPETLRALMRFCQRRGLHLISDEVYGSSVFSPTSEGDNTAKDDDDENKETPLLPPFTSALSISSEEEEGGGRIISDDLLHVTYGFSKDFGAPGLRLGALVSRSETLHRAIRSGAMRFANPSGPSVAVARAMLADRGWCRGFLERSRSAIAGAHARAVGALGELGVRCAPANAGFFLYADLRPWLAEGEEAEFELAGHLLGRGVFVHPREEHGPRGWFRLVYTQEPGVVDEGIRRLAEALGSVSIGG